MKRNIILSVILLTSFVFVQAQTVNDELTTTNETQAVETAPIIESAGITPESPFFFIDRLGEKIKEIVTINKGDKARLQARFAAERVAEIKAILALEGDHTKGIEKGKKYLLENVSKSKEALIIAKESGNHVTILAKELNDSFSYQEKELGDAFWGAHEKLLNEQKNTLKAKLKEATASGDTAIISAVEAEIKALDASAESFKEQRDDIRDSLREEKKDIVKEMDQEAQDNYEGEIETEKSIEEGQGIRKTDKVEEKDENSSNKDEQDEEKPQED